MKNYLNSFIDTTNSDRETEQARQSMSDGQKYHLLKHHDKLSASCIFPIEYLRGATRSFLLKWIRECGWWLVYSSKLDGAFCICLTEDIWVLKCARFRKWHHKSKVITAHVNELPHIAAFQTVGDYIQSIEFPVIMYLPHPGFTAFSLSP